MDEQVDAAEPAATMNSAAEPVTTVAAPETSLALAVAGGAAAMIVSAAIWGAITFVIDFQVGWMAIGVGVIVGFAVRLFGGGRSFTFGVLSAVLAVLGVLLGNLVFFTGVIAEQEGIAFLEVLGTLLVNPDIIVELFTLTFEVVDVLFYGLAVYVGFRTASA